VYRGALVVPQRFKERIWDVFISPVPGTSTICTFPGLKKIVIDAGHGGHDPGAISRRGVREKEINLDIAKRLASLLRQDGVDVVMTRSTDVFIPLEKRSEIAQRAGAAAFVSIHSNSSRRKTLHGFEVYYVSNTAYDPRRAKRARSNGRIHLATPAYASDGSESGHDTFTQSRARSIALSSSVARCVEKNMGVTILGVKAARFEVLKSAYMPAVLVEVGFLSNSYEERRLQEAFYRQRMAEAIAEGIRGYASKESNTGRQSR
jgi:N-acetylmuramoyl-L-alanine amidase